MGTKLSMDLRERVVAAYEAGEGSLESVATTFRIGSATLKRLVARKRKTGSLEADKAPNGFPPKLEGERLEALLKLSNERPDLTTQELTDELNKVLDVTVSRSGVMRALTKLGLTRKKKRSEPPSGTARTSRSGKKPSAST